MVPGAQHGDEIRKMVGAFYDNVRTCDYVFRYGRDEFLILLTEITEADTLCRADPPRMEKIKGNAPRARLSRFLFSLARRCSTGTLITNV
jgi:diguanylate cyclase